MADLQRKTANLFSDKLIGMTWWDGVITADERFTLYIAEVKPNTEYTASGNNSVDNIMVTYYSVYPAEGQSSVESVRYIYPTNPTRSVASFTTPDDSRIKYAAVRFGSDATEVMFNLGSTAFTYEPYGWVHSLCKLATATDSITSLPAVLYPTDTTATVGLKGNMVQNGAPSPTTPIQPQECGDMTGNLLNVPALSGVRWATQYPVLLAAINSLPNGVYTMSISYELTSRNDTTDSSVCGWYIAKDSRVLSNVRHEWETAQIGEITTVVDTFTIDDNNRGAFTSLYLYGCGINGVGPTGTAIVTNIMLNSGSTALPYEPYGYKIPISSAGTTTPVYLGEVETTRKVKKLVLTAEETINGDIGYNRFIFTLPDMRSEGVRLTKLFCTHYQNISDGRPIANVPDNSIYTGGGADSQKVFIKTTDYTTVADFKAYLAAQYAAGTPVTVWYVLATEETGIVNEPLRKIGDYADKVSGITIPTIAGVDSVDIETTVKPSEVSLAYTGWHDAQCKEYDGSQWV